VDIHTDSIVQSIVREEVIDCAIISVAYRLEIIVDFDKVACLNAGRIVERDSPRTLLKTEGSNFRNCIV
jgi:ABC-type multidrug transport system fused ATPase/permease subunit